MKRALLSLMTVLCLVAALAALAVGCFTTEPPKIATKLPDEQWEFQIVKVKVSEPQTNATVAFSAPLGIFAFQLEPLPPTLTRLSFGLLKEKHCEGLGFRAAGQTNNVDLLHTKGVSVIPEFDGLVIHVLPPALDLLKKGGRVMFVNQFR